MATIKRVVLDVLKPHHPNSLEFSRMIADVGNDYRVHVMVIEVDEKTETLQVIVEGEAVDFDAIQVAITSLGGSLHSIDEVNVHSKPPQG